MDEVIKQAWHEYVALMAIEQLLYFFSIKSWDALSDSLWEGLWALSADRILIIWPHSDRMFDSPEDFEMAVNVVQDVVTTLADPDAANGRPNEVNVLIS